MLLSGELNIELQHHISTRIMMPHVLKARVAIGSNKISTYQYIMQ